jgi:hypothetical protein
VDDAQESPDEGQTFGIESANSVGPINQSKCTAPRFSDLPTREQGTCDEKAPIVKAVGNGRSLLNVTDFLKQLSHWHKRCQFCQVALGLRIVLILFL